MEKIVLQSTQKGYASQYTWSMLSFLGIIWFAWCCSSYVGSVYETLGVSSLNELHKLSFSTKTGAGVSGIVVDFAYIGAGIFYIVAGIIALVNLFTFVLETKESLTFFKGGSKSWNRLISQTYTFPFTSEVAEAVLDRIITVTVKQGIIDRILNTGTLQIEGITFTNAVSQKKEWTINGIDNPYARKRELESALKAHEGLMVKLMPEQE